MFRLLPPFGGDQRAVAEIVNGIMNGKTNNIGRITLSQSSTTTTLTDARIGADSVILFTPLSDHSASEMAHLYISAQALGSATITHRNTGHADLNFQYIVVG
jgi:voltage-gated potassium channel Kch